MVFGLSRKEHRVPDLSRYDYYYKDKDEANTSAQFSAAAAYAASTGTAPQVDSARINQPVRAQSMTFHGGYQGPQQRQRTSARIASAGVNRASNLDSNYKTYSLRSQTSVQAPQGRTNSVTSSSKFNKSALPRSKNVNSGSRANSITIKTTEVKDLQGRTQSITKRTVRRVNGYKYVETTTTTTQAIPVVDSDKHFDEFSGNYILQDNGLDELSEEDDQHDPIPAHAHAYVALTNPKGASARNDNSLLSDGEVPLEQTSSISNFSDALDYVPGETTKNRPKANKVRQASIKNKQPSNRKIKQATPKPLTEQEMYDRALAIAHQKVYSDHDQQGNASNKISRQSTMGQRNLRTSALVSGKASERMEEPNNSKKASKKLSGFFNVNSSKSDVPSEPALLNPAVAALAREQNSRKKRMSDDEMYAQALAIAQSKYNQANLTVTEPIKQTPSKIETGASPPKSSNLTNDKTQKLARESIGDPIRVPAPHLAEESAELPPAKTTAVETDEVMIHSTEPLEPQDLEAVVNGLDRNSRNQSANEQESQIFEEQMGITATKTTTPEALPVGTALPGHKTVSKTESQEHKSKFKNMFDKMKQFSAENSGFQSPKGKADLTLEPMVAENASVIPDRNNRSSFQRGQAPGQGEILAQDENTTVELEKRTSSAGGGSKLAKPKKKKNFIQRLFNRS